MRLAARSRNGAAVLEGPPDGFVPLALGGSTVYVSPKDLAVREREFNAKNRAFFEDFSKAIGLPKGGSDPGKLGTVFTSGRMTSPTASGSIEKPRDTPNFAFLRNMRKYSPIDSIIIKIRLDQIRRVAKRSPNARRIPGWRVRHIYADDPNFQNTPEIQRRCLERETAIEHGLNPYFHPGGFRSVQLNFMEDELVLDRKAIVYDNIVRGKPVGWHLVDPATVRPRLDALLPELDAIAAKQKRSIIDVIAQPSLVRQAAERLSEVWNVDMTDAMYVQEVEGRVTAAWKEDEICLDMVYTSTEINRWGYGSSSLEQSLWWTLAFALTAQYNADIFKQNYPEAIMFLYGDYEPEGLLAFKKQLMGEDAAGMNWRLPVIPGGENMKAEIQKLRDTPRDMLFTQWLKMLTAFKCACYRMNPELVNFDLVQGSDQTLFQSGSGEARVSLSQEEGLHSSLDGIGDFITRALILPYDDDLCFQYVGLNALTEQQETEMFSTQLEWRTPNEVRAREGELPPIAGPDAQLGSRLLNPVGIQLAAGERQQAFAEQQYKDQMRLEAQAQKQAAAAAQPAQPAAKEAPPSAGGRNHRAPTGGAPQRRSRTNA